MNDDRSTTSASAGEASAAQARVGEYIVGEIVELTIPHEASYIRVVRLAVSGIAALCGFDIDAIDDLRLAVDELCVCCVQCGIGPITVQFAWADEVLDIRGRAAAGPDTAAMLEDRRFDLSHQIVFAAVGVHRLYIDDEWLHFSFSRSIIARPA